MRLSSIYSGDIPGTGMVPAGVILMSNPAGRPRVYADVTLTCRQCQNAFSMRGAEARGYEKKHGRIKPFCSLKCFYEASNRHVRDLTEVAPTYFCEGCGKETPRRRDVAAGKLIGWDIRQKFCTLECFHEYRFAQEEARRAAGNYAKGHISQDGYHVVKGPRGQQLRMHRVVMEKAIGRKLRGNENVHHVNGDRADNRLENLELWVKTQLCGQRAIDKVRAAIALLVDYPDLVVAEGYFPLTRGGVRSAAPS